MSDIKETAIAYGVPMPETCVEMQWQGKTHFYWDYEGYLFQKTRQLFECLTKGQNNVAFNMDGSVPFFLTPAPQMHEILKDLPELFLYNDRLFELRQYTNGIGYIIDSHQYSVFSFIYFLNHHYAQAYAELWLKLKPVADL